MDAIDKLVSNIKRSADSAKQSQIRFVECTAVDWENKTMDGKGTSDGVEYFDIILGFGYIDIKPTIGTTCLIGIIDGQEVVTFLINAEQVDLVEIKSEKLQFNDGLNLGLVKIKKLTGRLNDIEKTINSHLNEYRIHNHSHPQGATTGFITPPITPDVDETDLDDIEDKNITH